MNQIRQAEDDLGFMKDRFLRQHGWNNRCDTPGAYWLWEKRAPGGEMLLLDREHAIQMQMRCVDRNW